MGFAFASYCPVHKKCCHLKWTSVDSVDPNLKYISIEVHINGTIVDHRPLLTRTEYFMVSSLLREDNLSVALALMSVVIDNINI